MKSDKAPVLSDAESSMLDEILEIERACFSDPWSHIAFEGALDNPAFTFRVCRVDGRIAGYVLGMSVPPEAEIANIAVLPEMRRMGIGSLMLEDYMSLAGKMGCNTFFLEVRQSNLSARALYESMGYRPIGIRKNYYKNPKENAVVMIYEKPN